MICRAHAFLRNLRAGFYDLVGTIVATDLRHGPRVSCAWDTLTTALLAS